MARVTLEQMRRGRQDIDQAKLDATTEADIERHMREDGQDPDAKPIGYRRVPPLPSSNGEAAPLRPTTRRTKARI